MVAPYDHLTRNHGAGESSYPKNRGVKVKLAKLSLVFISLVVVDAVISFIAINSRIAYELNPIYHSMGQGFWPSNLLGALAVVGLATRLREDLAVKGLRICSCMMVAVISWNLI